jgi:hypothetical protein
MQHAATQQEQELREMVQSVALALAARTVAGAEQVQMSQAQMVDTVDVAGVKWEMSAVFYRETMVVRLVGRAVEVREGAEGVQGVALDDAPQSGVVFLDMTALARMFGGGQGASFDYTVPVAWVLGAREASEPA